MWVDVGVWMAVVSSYVVCVGVLLGGVVVVGGAGRKGVKAPYDDTLEVLRYVYTV